jgi:hypothetical protein
MQQFWWGHKNNISRISWMSWERMGVAKDQGRLDIRDFLLFNKVLLAKYIPNSTIWEVELGTRLSLAWRSMLAAKELLSNGSIWMVGDGQSIKVWGDRWLPTLLTYPFQSPRGTCVEGTRVCELIDQQLKQLNEPLIRATFNADEAMLILNISLSPLFPRDRPIWRCTKKGDFSVRSAYHLGVEMTASQKPSSVMEKTRRYGNDARV